MPNEAVALAIISPERGIQEKVRDALEDAYASSSFWAVSDYPTPAQLAPLRDAPAGCIVILDFSDPRRAKAVAAELDHNYSHAATVALFSGKPSPSELMDLMQLGIREVVSLPITATNISQAAARAGRKLLLRRSPDKATGQVCAFLPAKPGVGATTIATHTAAAIGRLSAQRTLLIDLDLKLGMTSFLLKLDTQNSVLDALSASANLDATLWDQLVCHRGHLEILSSAPAEIGSSTPASSVAEVLTFARQHYEATCVDLPGDSGECELEALRQAREIFLICSPDLGILHMAKRKSEMLRSLGLEAAVSVIMNRADSRGSMPISDIEHILQLPVSFSVSSEYIQIAEATQKGIPMEGRSPIVVQFENIARHINPRGAPEPKGRKFIEMFSVTPVRDRLSWKH